MTIERPMSIVNRPSSERLHRFAVLVAVSVVALVTVGAVVTSTKSGDAIPDWPTSYGALIPKQLVGGILYEWSHRTVAGVVALLILALAVWLSFSPVPRWVKMLGWFAVMAVIAQAILGGLRVLVVSHEKVQATALAVINSQHPDVARVAFAVAHATLAQIVLGLTFAIALFTKPVDKGVFWASSKPLSFSLTSPTVLSLLLLVLVFLQLLLGAIVRHTDSGLVIPDFPTSFGKIIPTFGDLPFDPNNPQRMSYGEFAF
ncbi:MAG: COX15/CtaA family protein, partial [Armatimonadota bacterium]